MKRMKGFSAVNRFKKTALQVIAHRLDDKSIKNLREQFHRMDLNGDGKLTLSELQKAFSTISGANRGMADIDAMFHQIDVDNSGEIGYTEFLAAMIEGKTYNDEESCWEAFRIFDRDGDGSITIDELQAMLKDNAEVADKMGSRTEEVAQLFREADANNDGVITFDEFFAMMQKN